MGLVRSDQRASGAAPRWPGAAWLLAASLAAAMPAAAQDYVISAVPLVVPSALEPNIVLSLDDSPGMANAFPLGEDFAALVPSVNGLATDGAIAPANTRRFKSSAFNALYYNPNVRYVVPENAMSKPNSTFGKAWMHGYYVGGKEAEWSFNLASEYRPTLSYGGGDLKTHRFANHACADLPALSVGKKTPWTCVSGVPSPSSAVSDWAPAYYANFDTASCDIASAADRSDDNCYTLVVLVATTENYTIPSIGTPDNGRPECTTTAGTTTCTFAQESQNFANWYAYYRTRHLAMVTGAWRVMSDPKLIGTRLAWQALNACNSFAAGHTCTGYNDDSKSVSGISNLIDVYSSARRTELRNWLRRAAPAAAGTTPAAPLRAAVQRAGDYYSVATSPNNPYRLFPQAPVSTSNPEYACRPNFQLLLAGSSYDGSDSASYCSGTACGNKDGSSLTLPDGTTYTGSQRPYTDGNSNSLADVAFHYWATDLRSGLANVLLPYIRDRSGGSAAAQYWNARNDPARWQHMVNFTVGVGLGASLTDPSIPWTGDAFGGPGYANLLSGVANWPATATAGSSGRMYDLWHAALNSRGEFFSADQPAQVVAAMNAALARTLEQADVGAALAANSTRLTTESTLYQASFSTGCFSETACGDTTDWTGRLRAIRVNLDGSLGAELWSATAPGKIPAAAARKIFTASAATTGIAFTWAALGPALQPRIGDEATLDYLRGDQSQELANGGAFRDRSVRLGDIVNSDIVFSGVEDFGYDALIDPADLTSPASVAGLAYPVYLQSKATRTKVVIVGANDGMLHGFDAASGAELFAYVPRALLLDPISETDPRSNLVRLADPAYAHRFYVDGSSWVGDAYWSGAWRTVVVGTTGAGGKGIFALDISDPDAMSASKLLWDLDGQSDPNLGYTIGQPVIGRLHDGNFYAIFGNGYKSTNQCPVLYIVRLHDGQVRRIATGDRALTDTCGATPNGLGRPSLFDKETPGAQGYRTTDYVYAGDLRGNLWRFDLRSVNLTSDATAATSAPVRLLFAPGLPATVQPITGTIEIGAAPSSLGSGAAMLWFGTGRWFAVGDRVDTSLQTMYGLVDRFETSGSATSPKVTRIDLVAQSINVSGAGAGTITGSTVPYTATGSGRRDGWYLDLPRAGERMVGLPLIQTGRLIFPTLIPSEDKCAGGGTSSILAVDPYNGIGLTQRIFISQPTLDFIGSTVGIIRNLAYISAGAKAFLFGGGSTASSTTGSTIQFEEIRPAEQGAPRGRVSWREIVR